MNAENFSIEHCQLPVENCPVEICCEKNENCWIFNGDLLYWRALQNGLNCECSSGIKNHEWNLGYRIGIEKDFACSCWDTAIEWTHFNCNTKQGHKHVQDSSSHERNHSKWKLDFNTVDVSIGRDFEINSCAALRPYFGLRGVWVDEKLFDHQESLQTSTLTETFVTADRHKKSEFWGVGPQLGLEFDWALGCGLGFYGNISAGVLYGNFHIKSREKDTFTNPTETFSCKNHHDCEACEAVADAELGFSWKQCVFCNKVNLEIRLGWEHHQYFDHNKFGGYGDLCLDGAVISLRLGF